LTRRAVLCWPHPPDAIIVLHLVEGRDFFLTVAGRYVASVFGQPLRALPAAAFPPDVPEPVGTLVDYLFDQGLAARPYNLSLFSLTLAVLSLLPLKISLKCTYLEPCFQEDEWHVVIGCHRLAGVIENKHSTDVKPKRE